MFFQILFGRITHFRMRAYLIVVISIAFCSDAFARTVTVVAHGMDSNAQTWVKDIAAGICDYTVADSRKTTAYMVLIFVIAPPIGGVRWTREHVYGVPLTADPDQDIVIAFDWSPFARSLRLFGAPIDVEYSNDEAAFPLSEILTLENALPGLNKPLAQNELHLIGHSRGASLMCGVADYLSKKGHIVDQLTLLDTDDFYAADVEPRVTTNVIFAEAYYQQHNTVVRGRAFAGAYSRSLTLWDSYLPGIIGQSDIPTVSDAHSNVHRWYYYSIRFIDWSKLSERDAALYRGWWKPEDDLGQKAGYWLARCPHGVRPSDGFKDRSIGIPRLAISRVNSSTFEILHPARVSGRYSADVSGNLKEWASSRSVGLPDLIFDGRPFKQTFNIPTQIDAAFFRLQKVQ